MKIGQIVYSKAGRDKGKVLTVIANGPKGAFVVDGKERPLERPKLKNLKHLSVTNYCLREEEYHSNKALRSSLKGYKFKNDEF